MKKFWKYYKISVTAILTLITLSLTTLYIYLNSYELSMPTNYVDKVINWINNNDINNILDNLVIDNKEINNYDYIKETLKFKKGKYFYVKKSQNKKYYSYDIYNESKVIGTVNLKKKNKKGIFNFDRWQILSLKGFINEKDITIIVPSEAKVRVNNVLIKDKYIIDNDYKVDKIEYMAQFVNMDQFKKYEIKNVYKEKVKVEINGKEIELKNDNNVYTYVYEGKDELLEEQKEYIETFLKKYTKYVVKETGFLEITPYVLYNSNAYNFLKDISLTNLWSGDHSATQFSKFEYSNMQYYNENAFSVEVNYTYSYVVGDNPESSFDTKINLYMINKDNKWYVVGLNT